MQQRVSRLLKATMDAAAGADSGPEETHWQVGGRYKMLAPTTLYCRPDLSGDAVGRLRAKDATLLLAIQSAPARDGYPGEMLIAYLADTRKNVWVCGWGQIEGGGLPGPLMRRKRLKGSWEVGGRHIVAGSPVLRSGIELESEQMANMAANEEVLLLEMGLVIRSFEPRLRARVRTDVGVIGWLTIELPGGDPLLEPANLYTPEAVCSRRSSFRTMLRPPWDRRSAVTTRRPNGARVSVSSRTRAERSGLSAQETWEPGGKYLVVASVSVHKDVAEDTPVISVFGKGTLVLVSEVQEIRSSIVSSGWVHRLNVTSQSLESSGLSGWISGSGSHGEPLVDTRDHLEYEKVLMELQNGNIDSKGAEIEKPAEGSPLPPDVEAGTADNVTPRTRLEVYSNPSREDVASHDKFSSPWRRTSGTPGIARPLTELEARPLTELEECNNDDKPFTDATPEPETAAGMCACRSPAWCGALKNWRGLSFQKLEPGASTPLVGRRMLGEPAPEPRPLRQISSPAPFAMLGARRTCE